jgi:hypothetical protein
MALQTSVTKLNLFGFQWNCSTVVHSYFYDGCGKTGKKCLQERRPLWAISVKFHQKRDVKTNHGISRTWAECEFQLLRNMHLH